MKATDTEPMVTINKKMRLRDFQPVQKQEDSFPKKLQKMKQNVILQHLRETLQKKLDTNTYPVESLINDNLQR